MNWKYLSLEQDVTDALDRLAVDASFLYAHADVHMGKGSPVGISVVLPSIRPIILGNDVGCGFGVYRLGMKRRKLSDQDAIMRAFQGLDEAEDDAGHPLSFADGVAGFGTIGGGNHFLELQLVNEANGIVSEGDILLMVHSGSRSHGEFIWRRVVEEWGVAGGDLGPDRVEDYLKLHGELCAWAEANRMEVARRAAERLRCNVERILDVPHNFVERVGTGFLHRKGCNPHDRGVVPVAGTRATESFLLAPADATSVSLGLPHGAGRRLTRSAARTATGDDAMFIKGRPINGIVPMVVCGDGDLLREERAGAYKDIHEVIRLTVDAEQATVIAKMQPVVTFKKSLMAAPKSRRDEPSWKKDQRRRHAWK